MHFSNETSPENLYMSIAEAMKLLGMDRQQVQNAQRRKDLDWDYIAGRTLLYRASVELYKDRLANASKPQNPYARTQEASHAP